ncbi:AMIN-like domain-containing (lipo)protein [Cellulomonas sp.]|uniref:AMIN-like domain-containing (lipo)protein n=1 Tax=Cellulomonas sp. TaxID=40001 RepID=UPI003BACA3B7
MPGRSRRIAGLVAGTALLLASCADGGPATPSQTATTTPAAPSASATPTTDPTPTAVATETEEPVPFPADLEPDEQASSDGAMLTLTDVTTGEHDGYDRVVFRFGGTGAPGWMVRYVDRATDDPADTVLDIAGDGTLAVTLLGVQIPDTTGIPEWSGTNPVLTPGYTTLREVNVRGQFEGQELAFLGVDTADHPFRVFALADPARVVVDVRHDG